MKCQIPQISWHSRDPVLSIDFQPGKQNIPRLATGGTDSHVLIWYIIYQDNNSIKVECASDLYRHNKSVNVVRFSPNGELLASGDDEGAMFIWQLKERDSTEAPKDEENVNQEDWYPLKLLRGHLEDIYDISWSSDSNFLVSASMDNTAIVWDMQKFQKVHIYSDSKGYVQGVAWDPLNVFIASVGSDRALRFLNIATKKTTRVQRAPWSVTTEKGSIRARLFYDDTLKSYFRRLCFTPDGELLLVPSGIMERESEKPQNTTYVFSRHAINKPAAHLPTGDKYTVAVRCNPLLFKLRSSESSEDGKENQTPKSKPLIDLPYRMIFAVAACDSVLLYDTEQLLPFGHVSNIHYTHLTDLSWPADGRILCASSTDGYCSFLSFGENELGEEYVPPPPPVIEEKEVILPNPTDKKPDLATSESKTSDKLQVKASAVSESDKKYGAVSPSSKQSPVEAPKSDKKPKLCTIKNFFASPKAKTEGNSPKPVSLISKAEVLEQSQQAKVLLIGESEGPKNDTKIDVSKASGNPDAMEVDEDSIKVVFEAKPPAKPKCKAQLLFSIDTTIEMVARGKEPSLYDKMKNAASNLPIAEEKAPSEEEIVVEPSKPCKVPKRGTITNFFTAPRSQLGTSSPKSTSLVVASKVSPKESPSQNQDPPTVTPSPKDRNTPKTSFKVDSMEIDDSNKAKEPKCKAQLKFPEDSSSKEKPTKPKSIIPDLIDCSAVLSFDDSKSSDRVAENLETDQSDWKLELSQDEDIPMETSPPVVIAKSPDVKPGESVTPKPKRRIPLTTLSKTVSMSGSKF